MSFTIVLFYLLALVLVIAAFRVVTASSPVVAVLHLILAFFTASMLWMLQNAEFLSLLLIVVYVGAVMVMFLFVIMMLDMRTESMFQGIKPHMPLGLGIALIMIAEIAFVISRSWFDTPRGPELPADYNNTLELGIAMYTKYAFAVEIGGIVLLVGMISAISLTLRKRSDVKYNNPAQQVRVKASERVRLVDIASGTETPASDNTDKGNA